MKRGASRGRAGTRVISALLFGVSLNRSWLTPQRFIPAVARGTFIRSDHVSQLLEQPEPFNDPVLTHEI
jgi:hypothetical protein